MTLALPVIYFNQAFAKIAEMSAGSAKIANSCVTEWRQNSIRFLTHYRDILKCPRSDKAYVGLPKYATKREIGELAGWSAQHDDRSLLTLLLEPGEYTQPLPISDSDFHLNIHNTESENVVELDSVVGEIISALKVVHVVYYRPNNFIPAIRLEIGSAVAKNKHRLATVLRGLKEQSVVASMLEPYPLYMADRMAKSLTKAIPAFRQIATQRISEDYNGDIGEVFFAMHGYRSEGGR